MADGHYLVLARKWRPQAFDAVVGQEHITRTLQNAIVSGRIGHAFLFIGSRGIGKTTTARILAKALNCVAGDGPTPNPCGECANCTAIAIGNAMDVVEIDGASNNSVDDVRQIRENIQLVPSSSRYKIYIIDEVHQLSAGAFNALLKTLEEPPAHAIFILATTESHKVPPTIISRCQRYDFRRVGMEDIRALLIRILESEGIAYTDEALYAIARAADGGIRDSESILEQVISYCGDNITYEAVYEVLGLVEWGVMHRLCDAMIAKDIATQLGIVEDVVVSGKDLPQFIQEILGYFRNLLVCKTADGSKLLAMPPDELKAMRERAAKFSLTELIRLVEQFSDLFKRDFDAQLAPRIALEALLIRCSRVAVEVSLDTVLEKLAQLGAGGLAMAAPAPGAPPGAPDPPKPLPGPRRPAAEAPPKKPAATEETMAALWRRIDEALPLSQSVHTHNARPVAIEGDTLVLEIDPSNGNAIDAFSKPDFRAAVEAKLAEWTANLAACRAITAEPKQKPNGGAPAMSHLLRAASVRPEEAEAALADPVVAAALDTFRGRIVQVKREAAPDDDGAEDDPAL